MVGGWGSALTVVVSFSSSRGPWGVVPAAASSFSSSTGKGETSGCWTPKGARVVPSSSSFSSPEAGEAVVSGLGGSDVVVVEVVVVTASSFSPSTREGDSVVGV